MTKITSFTQLDGWKQSHILVLHIYRIIKLFPKNETYSLTDQLKRASVSVSSNIAEGFSRFSNKEKLQFYYIARGSLTEIQNQLMIAKDVGYIDKETFDVVAEQTVRVYKLINGLIKKIKSI